MLCRELLRCAVQNATAELERMEDALNAVKRQLLDQLHEKLRAQVRSNAASIVCGIRLHERHPRIAVQGCAWAASKGERKIEGGGAGVSSFKEVVCW